ncbi:MAG: hypothetical protein PWQ88_6 [Candidatus Methanomethylophilaceae archaeon]|nr:hypothetical protein [Candidatus Methanomethylophilaceae archaeon]
MNEKNTLISYNPITDEIVGEVPISRADEIPILIRNAKRSRKKWGAMERKQQLITLSKLLSICVSRTDEICETICRETGKPFSEALNTEILASLTTIDWCIDWLRRQPNTMEIHHGKLQMMIRYLGRSSYIRYRPLGVVAIISPFNFPLAIPFTQAVMSVTAGNAVILKPSSKTPISGHLIESLFLEAGFPPNLVKVISGPEIGEALTLSDVDRIIFTGSSETGRKVMASASQRLTPVTLELGGKDAMIVTEDADLKRAASGAVWGAFVNSGQVCAAVKRLIVHKDIYSYFLDLVLFETEKLKQGNSLLDPDVSIGAMIDKEAVQKMEEQVGKAVHEGGRVLIGGSAPKIPGSFFQPTIISELPPKATMWKTETFGPILLVTSYEDDDEAVRLANDSDFALTASVWTRNLERGKRMASSIRAGTVMINNVLYTYGLPATPWGGSGESGFGRTHGQWGMMELMEPHHIHVDKGNFPHDIWWFPYSSEGLELNRDMINGLFAHKGVSRLSSLLNVRKGFKDQTRR